MDSKYKNVEKEDPEFVWNLDIGTCNLFGAWNLGFGAFKQHTFVKLIINN